MYRVTPTDNPLFWSTASHVYKGQRLRSQKVTTSQQSLAGRERFARLDGGDHFLYVDTVRRLRPLRRRLASTFWPPAVAIRAQWVATHFGDDVPMLALPPDHLVQDVEACVAVVGRPAEHAGKGRFVTFGIAPSLPGTVSCNIA